MHKTNSGFRYWLNLNIFSYHIKKCIRVKIKDVMTKRVVTITPQDSLSRAANVMRAYNISSLVVVKGNTPLGLITEQDFVRKLTSRAKNVEDIFTPNPITIRPDNNLFNAAAIMLENKFRKLVVMSGKKMVGIVTQTDLVKSLAYFGTKTIIRGINVPDVRDIMSSPVVTIHPDRTLQDAQKVMAAHKFGSLVVESNPVGIITERDLVNEFSKEAGRIRSFRVVNSMSSPIVSIRPEENLFKANNIMLNKGFRRMPVSNLEKGKGVIGIVTETDILRGLHEFILDNVKRIQSRQYLAIEIEKD